VAQWIGSLFMGLIFAFAVANVRRLTTADRRDRLSFRAAAKAGAIAFAGGLVFGDHGNPALAFAIAGGAALVVQVLTPWDERAARRRAEAEADEAGAARNAGEARRPTPVAPAPAFAASPFAPSPAAPSPGRRRSPRRRPPTRPRSSRDHGRGRRRSASCRRRRPSPAPCRAGW
jgi:hypothetical protein